MAVRRGFFDLGDRQLHYRCRADGDAPAILALHALPGSVRQLLPLIEALGARYVIAPDLPGLGDSDSHPAAEPTIADYARDMLALVDGLGLGTVDVIGGHAGAAVAIEMAILAPDRVRRIVLDGVPLFDPGAVSGMAARYVPRFDADHDGGHLLAIHNFCRDMLLFWPWYDKSRDAARGLGLPPARDLHDWVLETIKGMDAIAPAYRAAFTYDAAIRLPLVRQPALCITAAAETLAEASVRAAGLLPGGEQIAVENGNMGMADPVAVARAAAAFFDAGGD